MTKYRYGIDQFIFSLSVMISSIYLTYSYFNPLLVIVSIIIYKLTNIIGLGIGLHNNYCHNGKKITPWYYLSILCGIGSPIEFYKMHHLHHRYVDTTLDPTSVKNTNLISVLTGFWTTKSTSYSSMVDALIIEDKGRWVDKYYYSILIAVIIQVYKVSPELCNYLLLLPIVLNTLDSNILFNWFYHKSGSAEDSKLMSWWYMSKPAGYHKIHHRIFKEL